MFCQITTIYAIAGFFAYLVARTTLWMNQSHIKFSDLKCKNAKFY